MQPVQPPYRVEIQGIGIGVDPPRFPVKTHRTTPGPSGEICTPDEVAMWAYVEHLEQQVRELSAPTITVRELSEAEQDELQAALNKAVVKHGNQPIMVLPHDVLSSTPTSNPQPTGDAPVIASDTPAVPQMGPPKKRKGKQ